MRKTLTEDKQARMRAKDLATKEIDKEEEGRLRVEEKEADREREQKIKHGAGGIRMASNAAASSQPHQQTKVVEEEGDATASPVQHREGEAPIIKDEEELAPLF